MKKNSIYIKYMENYLVLRYTKDMELTIELLSFYGIFNLESESNGKVNLYYPKN